ncbi:MAG: c-type cytochrome [Prochloraceae cyanobacterium]|nr:c-type cytochrome [Prochloraceae cyanobacterium]
MKTIFKRLIFSLIIAIAIAYNTPVLAADLAEGAKIFKVECAGCHPNGGNIIRRGKNLKLRALHRNKVDSIASISALVANGKNNMSAYGDRLSATEIDNVSAYVLKMAENNWR